ncbi:MAG: DUF1634 domain-containing protein [Bacillota bacterium]
MSDDHSAPRVVNMEVFISRVLRTGVLLSAGIIAVGLVLLFATGRTGYTPGPLDTATLTHWGSRHLFPTGMAEVVTGVLALRPFAIIALGLLVLIATPVIRVAASVVAFLFEGDTLYVFITLYVLTILIVSFLLGRAGG